MLEIDLLKFQSQLRLQEDQGQTLVYDPIRKKTVVLQPEELVRQLVLRYLLDEMQYPSHRIRVEIGITYNGLKKRCDIVIFDKAVQPWLVLECKSPKVPISLAVFEQAARYNLQLQAPYLAATNGLATCVAQLDFEQSSFQYLPAFPIFPPE